MSTQNKLSLFKRILAPKRVYAEKDRLEAFLAAFPGEYCGFNPDGSLAYSLGFLTLLGIPQIRNFEDIQHALRAGDAAALESCLMRLKENRQKFILKVQTIKGGKILRFTGAAGHALNGTDSYEIIWVEDITATESEIEKKRSLHQNFEHEIKKFHTLLGAMTTPLWMYDSKGIMLWCNQAYARLLGKTPDEVLDEKLEIAFSAPKKKNAHAAQHSVHKMVDIALTTATVQSEYKYIVHAGNRHLMKVDIIPITHLDVTIGQAIDVTKEEDLERRSERNNAAHKELFEQLHAAIAIFEFDQRLEFYNSAFAQLWRLEPSWLDTKPKLSELMERLREMRRLPEQADFRKFKQSWLDMFTATQGPHEDMLYLPDDTVIRSSFMPHPLGGLLMMFEDVTSKIEMESSYNTLMAIQRETLDNLNEGVAVYGENGRLRLWNPAYAKMWDLNPEDLQHGMHISEIIDRCRKFYQDAGEDAARDSKWSNQRQNMVNELFERQDKLGQIHRSDGKILNYAAVALPDGGKMVTFHDVTDSMQVETVLRDKNSALEAAEKLKIDFLANVSYQLRTPLNAIIGFNEILDQEYFGPLNPRQKEYTKGMGEASQRLLNLINDILDLSSLEAGYLVLQYAPIDIYHMLRSIFDLTQEWARGQLIEMTLDCDQSIGFLEADERRLKQALINLIRNAISYTPAAGRISLSAMRTESYVEITVKDTGGGIAPEDIARILKPFEKTRAAQDEKQSRMIPELRSGAGLGLTLVKNIIDLHKGELRVESEVGVGSSFTIRMPLTATLTPTLAATPTAVSIVDAPGKLTKAEKKNGDSGTVKPVAQASKKIKEKPPKNSPEDLPKKPTKTAAKNAEKSGAL